MQITTNKLEKTFEPIELRIVIQSKVEFDALLTVTGSNVTVADTVSENASEEKLITDMLANIYGVLRNINN
jgi:hypothetical protein